MAAQRMSKLGVEVPLHRVDRARVPVLSVECGPPAFEFPPVAGAAGRVRIAPLSPATRHTLWQLDAAEPSELMLVEYGFACDWEETALRVRFGAPLLPTVGTVVVPQATQVRGANGRGLRLSEVAGALCCCCCSRGGTPD